MATDLSADEARSDPRIVTTIRIMTEAWDRLYLEGYHDNYWSIYLLLEEGGSFCIDMLDPNDPRDNGMINFSESQDIDTPSRITYKDYDCIREVSVSEIVNLIYDKETDGYDFVRDRPQTLDVILDNLCHAGIIEADSSVEAFWDVFPFQYKTEPNGAIDRQPMEVEKGAFWSQYHQRQLEREQ